MNQTLKCLLLAALACGAPVDEEEYGEAEQEFLALNSSTKQFGSRTGGSNLSCNKTSTSQVCSIPRFKKLQVVRDDTGTWTTGQRVNMQTVSSAKSFLFGWPINIVNLTAPADSTAVRVFIINGTVSGSSGSTVDLYHDVSFDSVNSLTEGLGGGLPAGSYQTHASCTIKLDRNKITAKGASDLEDSRLFSHAFGNGMAICMGVGTNSSVNSMDTQLPIDLTKFLDAGTAGEACRANFSDLADTSDFSIQTASVCAGD